MVMNAVVSANKDISAHEDIPAIMR